SKPSHARAFGSGSCGGGGNFCSLGVASVSVQQCWSGWARRLHQTSSPKPSAHAGWVRARCIRRSRLFFAALGRIGTGEPMFGSLPGPTQAAEGQPHGFVADQARGEALGETDLGGQGERPPTGRLAERPWTLVQAGLKGLAGPRIEDDR